MRFFLVLRLFSDPSLSHNSLIFILLCIQVKKYYMKRIYTPGKISIVKNVAVLIALFFSLMVSQGLKAQVLLTESFDGLTFVPVGWNNILTSGTNTWTRVTSGTFPTQATHSGAGEAKFNFGICLTA